MKPTGSEKKIKISKAFPIGIIIWLLLTSCLYTSFAKAMIIESNIPDLGQRADLDLTVETEETLGQGVMQKLRASEQVSQDPVINEYLNTLSCRLTTALECLDIKLDFKLKFFGFDSDVLNAFAFLGGHVAVHTGLIMALENEAELAAVLSHETAHIAQRHLARIFTNNKRLMPLTYAELLAALAIGVLGSPEAGSHLATAVMGGHVQRLINYTRDHEQEADRIGIQILAKAGFDPHAFPRVFRILSSKSRYNEKPPEYLLTHPVHESRIADSTNRLKHIRYEPKPGNELFFQLVRARIEAESLETPKQRLARLKDKMHKQQYQNDIALEYAFALALIKNKQFLDAANILYTLEQQNPGDWVITLTRAELEMEASNFAQALIILKPLFEKYPHLHPVILRYCETLIETKDSALAEKILSKQRKIYPNDLQVLQLLVKSYSQLRDSISLHRTQGSWHLARGEFSDALKQLDFATEYAKPDSPIWKQIRADKEKILSIMSKQKKTKV